MTFLWPLVWRKKTSRLTSLKNKNLRFIWFYVGFVMMLGTKIHEAHKHLPVDSCSLNCSRSIGQKVAVRYFPQFGPTKEQMLPKSCLLPCQQAWTMGKLIGLSSHLTKILPSEYWVYYWEMSVSSFLNPACSTMPYTFKWNSLFLCFNPRQVYLVPLLPLHILHTLVLLWSFPVCEL